MKPIQELIKAWKKELEFRKQLSSHEDELCRNVMSRMIGELEEAFKEGLCEFYPYEEEEPICDCGSDVSGPEIVCTKEYSKSCPWKNYN